MKSCLIVRGGWAGHQPVEVSQRFKRILEKEGFSVEISETLDTFLDAEKLKSLHLIIPLWTMGEITDAQLNPVIEAAASGVGIAGCHGGMCDAFRTSVAWQFMTGGNWVSHPGGDGVEYEVNILNTSSGITEGISDFTVNTEHYYLHIDPAVEVLAAAKFPSVKWYHSTNKTVQMPVVWTKRWGHGRVFYNALGHHDDIFDIPQAQELMRRGFLWAAEGRDIAIAQGLSADEFASDKQMF